MGYGDAPPAVQNARVLMVDFSMKREAVIELATTALSIVVIDHHKTAEAELAPWVKSMASMSPEEVPQYINGNRIVAFFDMEQSGCTMAWSFAHFGKTMPTLMKHVEDRDLWRNNGAGNLKHTVEINHALGMYDFDFETWSALMADHSKLIVEGKILMRSKLQQIRRIMAAGTYHSRVGGYIVPTCNCPYEFASETAHELLQAYPEAPFAACWFKRGDGTVQWSLRSEKERVDVSKVAARYGGGGHAAASGFEVPAL